MIKIRRKYLLVTTLLLSACFSNSYAIPVDINSLFVDQASVSLTSSVLGSASATDTFAPVEITMGSYQDPILSMGDSSISLSIYSTGAYGAPAPSGYVDGSMISVDLSSLRAALTYAGTTYVDIELWPLTTTLDYGTYDPGNGDFLVGWSEIISLDVSSYVQADASLNVELGGYLTTVPVPATFWLFGSGLIALAGVIRRRNKY